MKKILFLMSFILSSICLANAQVKLLSNKVAHVAVAGLPAGSKVEDDERPLNFFTSAEIQYRGGTLYSPAISPINKTLQFDETTHFVGNISAGVVWNPFQLSKYSMRTYSDGTTTYRHDRCNFAIALLTNAINVGLTNNQLPSGFSLDVGFGLGYRDGNFLILTTIEFPSVRQPRQYLIDNYLGKNLPLIPVGSTDPLSNLSASDDNLFISKIIPSLGLKIAYAFSTK